MSELPIKKITANGDCAILVQFSATKDRLLKIHKLCNDFIQKPLKNMINVIPATDSMTLVFSHPVNQYPDLMAVIFNHCKSLEMTFAKVQTHEIPVCYHPSVATDIEHVCSHLGISIEQLVQCHTQPSYQVEMLGFLPGFAYLSGTDKLLSVPRKAEPSLQVAAGSVAVAGRQTGLYALSSPGGWHVIGRTPIALLNWNDESQPMKLKPIDQVRFKAVSLQTFTRLNNGP